MRCEASLLVPYLRCLSLNSTQFDNKQVWRRHCGKSFCSTTSVYTCSSLRVFAAPDTKKRTRLSPKLHLRSRSRIPSPVRMNARAAFGMVRRCRSRRASGDKLTHSGPGIQRGDFHITDTFNGEVFRTSTRGTTPWNSFGRDLLYGFIAFVRPIHLFVLLLFSSESFV
jgi:hypothetical protein